jgi:hypothetical protein
MWRASFLASASEPGSEPLVAWRQIVSANNTMTSIRDALCHFIRLNDQGNWVPPCIAFQELEERFPQSLIPGLIECLDDGHPDVRRLAVELVAGARAKTAIPALIERLDGDDCEVQVAVIFYIRFFGPVVWLVGSGALPAEADVPYPSR